MSTQPATTAADEPPPIYARDASEPARVLAGLFAEALSTLDPADGSQPNAHRQLAELFSAVEAKLTPPPDAQPPQAAAPAAPVAPVAPAAPLAPAAPVTEAEARIQQLVDAGISRDVAEKVILVQQVPPAP